MQDLKGRKHTLPIFSPCHFSGKLVSESKSLSVNAHGNSLAVWCLETNRLIWESSMSLRALLHDCYKLEVGS